MAASDLAGVRHLVHADFLTVGSHDFPRRRRSASAEAALRAEIERVSRMTIEERVKAALSMKEKFTWLPPVSTPQQAPDAGL